MKTEDLIIIGGIGLGAYYLWNQNGEDNEQSSGSVGGGTSNFNIKKTSQTTNDLIENTYTLSGDYDTQKTTSSIIGSENLSDSLVLFKKNGSYIGGADLKNKQSITPKKAELEAKNKNNPIRTILRSSSSGGSSSSSSGGSSSSSSGGSSSSDNKPKKKTETQKDFDRERKQSTTAKDKEIKAFKKLTGGSSSKKSSSFGGLF
jgi:hypothetical protein